MTPRTIRVLTSAAKKPGMTESKVLRCTSVNCSLRTVQHRLSENRWLTFGPARAATKLDINHVKNWFKWASDMALMDPRRWRKVLFTDKKRFCLDVPDGLVH